MKWRVARPRARHAIVADPLVLTVTDPVTADTARDLVTRVGRMAADAPVVVDVTAIPGFDTDGAEALVGMQEELGSDRVTIVGIRQAAARLTGTASAATEPPAQRLAEWVIRRMRAIAVIHPSDDGVASTDNLEPAITAGLEADVGIVVVDLRGARLTAQGVETIAFASSTAALHGQELLVVNADEVAAKELRRAGLSATTYVAPEPLPNT
jgi:anti-anti-sigma regulatory factor